MDSQYIANKFKYDCPFQRVPKCKDAKRPKHIKTNHLKKIPLTNKSTLQFKYETQFKEYGVYIRNLTFDI